MERHRKKVENYAESNVSFPTKLYALMVNENGTSVEWVPHGFAFKISDQNAFLRQVIPKYFRHTKLTSFQRQLNLYGFRRVLKGDDEGAYYHPKFQRGKRDLINDIQRLPSKQSLMSLQEIMEEYSQPQSFQLNTASKKKKPSSPPITDRPRGRVKETADPSNTTSVKEDSMAVTSAATSLSTTYVRTNPRPKRTLTPSTSSAFTATVHTRAVAPRTARNSSKHDPPPPSPPSESTSSATDDESSYGGQRGRRGRRAAPDRSKLTHKASSFADAPVSPLSFAASPTTQVARYKESAYPTHDDYLDLSLTSPLFSAVEMMEPMPQQSSSRSNALLPSPTALAAATAQADFGSAMVHSQHAVDFAGLSNQQEDLAWTQHYSLGALGSLPLITDYSPHGNTPAGPDRPRSASPPDQDEGSYQGQGHDQGVQARYQGHMQWQQQAPGLEVGPPGTCVGGGLRDAFDDLLDFFVPFTSSQEAALLLPTYSTSVDAASSSSSSGYSEPSVNGGAPQNIHTNL